MTDFSPSCLTALPPPVTLASVLQPIPGGPGTQPFAAPAVAAAPPSSLVAPVYGACLPNQASMLQAVDRLKFFLATAPSHFDQRAYDMADPSAREERCLNRFQLPTGELISCVLWNGLFHVTGTDIVRVLHFRFAAFGRPVRNPKKFEEGIFSDLRNLKSGTDATLEEPKSEFLELLFKFNCIRTQKKQKVFYWFSVPHDRLFLDALDRDLKREKLGVEPTTEAVAEPALSFVYNANKSLYEQFHEHGSLGGIDGSTAATASSGLANRSPRSFPREDPSVTEEEGQRRTRSRSRKDSAASRRAGRPPALTVDLTGQDGDVMQDADGSQILTVAPCDPAHSAERGVSSGSSAAPMTTRSTSTATGFGDGSASAILGAIALFEGSPTYKQRRKPGQQKKASPLGHSSSATATQQSSSPEDSPVSRSPSQPGVNEHDSGASSRDVHLSGLQVPTLVANGSTTYCHPQSTGPFLGTMSSGALAPNMSPFASHSDSGLGAVPSAPSSAASLGTLFAFDAHRVVAPPAVNAVDLAAAAAQQAIATDDGTGKTYLCPLYTCGRTFKRYEHLKRHLRIHTEEKPYACTKCEKRFARTDNLSAHLKIHEKLAARQGSASSSDQRALEADEDAEDRGSPALTAYEHSPQPTTAFGASMSFHPSLPTPPMAPSEQGQSPWPFRLSALPGPAILTPDHSPDPSTFYGVTHRHTPVNGAVDDPRRFRSATPNSTQMSTGGAEMDAPRHASAGPTLGSSTGSLGVGLAQGTGASSSSSSSTTSELGISAEHSSLRSAPSVSPMMSSFQQQLSMVNSITADMQAADAAALLVASSGSSCLNSTGGGYLHPQSAASATFFGPSATDYASLGLQPAAPSPAFLSRTFPTSCSTGFGSADGLVFRHVPEHRSF